MRLAAIPLIITLVSVAAQAQTASRPETIDVALSASGEFVSQCQDAAGGGVTGATIRILDQGREVATATSGDNGWFRFEGLQPGSYHLSANHWSNPIRLWAHDAAPPVAQDPIVLILESRPASQSAPEVNSDNPENTAAPVMTEPAFFAAADDDRQHAQRPPFADPVTAEAVTPQGSTAATDPPHSTRFTAEKVSITAEEVSSELPRIDLVAVEAAPAQPPHTVEQATRPEVYQAAPAPMVQQAASSSDPVYNPFHDAYPVPPSLAQGPAGEEVAPLPAQQPAPSEGYPPPLVVEPAPEPYYPPGYCPPSYPVGPTVGDAILTGVGIGAITVGAIAIYKYDRHNDRVRSPASP